MPTVISNELADRESTMLSRCASERLATTFCKMSRQTLPALDGLPHVPEPLASYPKSVCVLAMSSPESLPLMTSPLSKFCSTSAGVSKAAIACTVILHAVTNVLFDCYIVTRQDLWQKGV